MDEAYRIASFNMNIHSPINFRAREYLHSVKLVRGDIATLRREKLRDRSY